MSQRTSHSDSAASVQVGTAEAGISLVPAGSDSHLDSPIVRIGPRTSEWLPDVNEVLLPVIERIVRELAWEYDPRVLRDEVPRQFPSHLQRKYGVGTGQNYKTETGENHVPVHPFVMAVSKLSISYGRVLVDELSKPRRRRYEWVRRDVAGAGTREYAIQEYSSIDIPSGIDSYRRTIIRLLEVGNYLPSVTLVLNEELWRDVPDERTAAESLEAITALSEVVDIRLIVSPRLHAHLTETHPDWADSYLTQRGGLNRPRDHVPGTESNRDAAWAAMGGFDDRGGRVRILDTLEPGSMREVRDLRYDDDVDLADGSVNRYVRELADEHNLLKIDDRPRYNRVWLTEAGVAAQELITPDLRVCHPEQTRLEDQFYRTRQSSTGIVCRANAQDPPHPAPDDSTDAATDSSSISVAASASDRCLTNTPQTAEDSLSDTGEASEDGYIQWLGPAEDRLDRWEMHERLMAGKRTEGVTLVDDEIQPFGDGRVGRVSCFDDDLLAAVEWGGPLPTLVRVTTALLSDRLWSKVLVPSAFGNDLERLYDGTFGDEITDILRLGAQWGWFGENQHDYDGFKTRYRQVRDYLLAKLPEATAENDSTQWAELAKDAHGLLTSVTQVYRAIGVDVTINIRIPDTRKLQAGEGRYQRFLNFCKHTIPKQAAFGVHSIYRLLYEDRTEKLKHRLSIEYGDREPVADLSASWVITGPTATRYQDDVKAAIERKTADLRESIREGVERGVDLRIPVVEGNTYGALKKIVKRHADQKGFSLDRKQCHELVRLAVATLGTEQGRCSPYSLAEALLVVGKARSPTDSLTAADLAYGIRQLPAKRLFPSLKPTMQKVLKVLLISDGPVGRSETIERAGVSGRSYDRNLKELAAVGIAESTNGGGHRKWSAWIMPWWSPLSDTEAPRTADGAESATSPPSRVDDVLYQAALDLDLNPEYELFESPISINEVFDALPQLDHWQHWFRIHYGLIDGFSTVSNIDEQIASIGIQPAGWHADQASLKPAG